MTRRTFCVAIALTVLTLPLPTIAAPIRATLYKNPQCSCCEAYAAYLRKNGFEVDERPTNDLAEISHKAGVPEKFQGCHTMFVDGYVVDGARARERDSETAVRTARYRRHNASGHAHGVAWHDWPQRRTVYRLSDPKGGRGTNRLCHGIIALGLSEASEGKMPLSRPADLAKPARKIGFFRHKDGHNRSRLVRQAFISWAARRRRGLPAQRPVAQASKTGRGLATAPA
jgi:Protein of unknown function, DUF